MRFVVGLLFSVCLLSAACQPSAPAPPADSKLDPIAPKKMLWAWERPEDLRFIDKEKYGVAFLAQTLTIVGDEILVASRRQPLEVEDGTFIMAVSRIET